MRTPEQMRDYQRKRRALLKLIHFKPRERTQRDDFKTVGGRQKYFACLKTKVSSRFGVYAFPPTRYRHNGRLTYGYSI